MFNKLNSICKRPLPFSIYTAETLWTEPHLAEQMLLNHLSQDTDMASRKIDSINNAVAWIDAHLAIVNKSICDLGCGPGLYTQRFAERGAKVYGIDFSARSIAYAQNIAKNSGQHITYEVSDYLKCQLPLMQDLVTMIYYDLCALSPQQRKTIFEKVRLSLRSGGVFVFDLLSKEAFTGREESVEFGYRFMNGFWTAEDYYAFKNTFIYEKESISLDKYTIIEKSKTWYVFNWMQYFDYSEIERELKECGFINIEVHYNTPLSNNVGNENSFLVLARA
ncbi:class I SAM-dependent methyltransferase [Desulfovibrio litoralis]|uniref:Methyltransferase domain-containing protein n=1 Tax=Desulfovibrio litoralis DSM 11393 TaxID=1121455 RepID=A0A1M7TL37_9BACT|nr:class I SAM-dependent methyltransferase [Desulfovibrio litoralis]SHN71406.1 Methyltransferase domain-containing protein [Desulfovibrio litoralis DSM 11393]